MPGASDVLSAVLRNPTDIDHVSRLVSDNVTYVSLNDDNPDLTSIMPWCGTHLRAGPESIVQTFKDVSRYWEIIEFRPDVTFGTDEHAAIFGHFTYRSKVMGKMVTSPFAVYARVKNGRCEHLRFMEDTLATSASFRSDGRWTFRSDPDGGEVSF